MVVDVDESVVQIGDKRKGNIDFFSKFFEIEEGYIYIKIVKLVVCLIFIYLCLLRKKWKYYV